MAASERLLPRVLVVDDDEAIRSTMQDVLCSKGFDVVPAANVSEALCHITTASFDALVTDLHMPNPGDGFTVISAMRHSQPKAVTLLVSGHPDMQSAMAAILLEADEILVKPIGVSQIAEIIHERIETRRPLNTISKERVSVILGRCANTIIEEWLTRAKQSKELSRPPLDDAARTGHLPKLIEDIVLRLSRSSATANDSDAAPSAAAEAHGALRYSQGYTPMMLVQESRLLQVVIFGTLQKNLGSLDFSLVLPDVMAIADEVDSQLTQSMESFMKVMNSRPAMT